MTSCHYFQHTANIAIPARWLWPIQTTPCYEQKLQTANY